MLCVQKIARIPDLPKLSGRTTRRLVSITAKNTIHFEYKIARRKFQLTVPKLISDSERKISDGSANVPT